MSQNILVTDKDALRDYDMKKIVFLMLICLLSLLLICSYKRFYSNKAHLDANKKRYVLFSDCNDYLQNVADGFEIKLREKPESCKGSEERINLAIKMLRNKIKDERPVLIEAKVSLNAGLDDNNSPVLIINYIDENLSVAKIAYQSSDGTKNNLPLDYNNFTKVFQFGGVDFNWIFILKSNNNQDDNQILKGKNNSYLIVPENIFEAILKLDGEIILLDKKDNIWDSIKITTIY
jgi:hypothetical protein